jgi:predicted small integral membrane protein
VNIGNIFFGGASKFQELSSISGFVSLFLNIAFILSGLILLFFFIMGGIGMMGSAGQNDPQKAEQAKKTITSAIIGFVIVFVSFWIVKLIGQLIGLPNLI